MTTLAAYIKILTIPFAIFSLLGCFIYILQFKKETFFLKPNAKIFLAFGLFGLCWRGAFNHIFTSTRYVLPTVFAGIFLASIFIYKARKTTRHIATVITLLVICNSYEGTKLQDKKNYITGMEEKITKDYENGKEVLTIICGNMGGPFLISSNKSDLFFYKKRIKNIEDAENTGNAIKNEISPWTRTKLYDIVYLIGNEVGDNFDKNTSDLGNNIKKIIGFSQKRSGKNHYMYLLNNNINLRKEETINTFYTQNILSNGELSEGIEIKKESKRIEEIEKRGTKLSSNNQISFPLDWDFNPFFGFKNGFSKRFSFDYTPQGGLLLKTDNYPVSIIHSGTGLKPGNYLALIGTKNKKNAVFGLFFSSFSKTNKYLGKGKYIQRNMEKKDSSDLIFEFTVNKNEICHPAIYLFDGEITLTKFLVIHSPNERD